MPLHHIRIALCLWHPFAVAQDPCRLRFSELRTECYDCPSKLSATFCSSDILMVPNNAPCTSFTPTAATSALHMVWDNAPYSFPSSLLLQDPCWSRLWFYIHLGFSGPVPPGLTFLYTCHDKGRVERARRNMPDNVTCRYDSGRRSITMLFIPLL